MLTTHFRYVRLTVQEVGKMNTGKKIKLIRTFRGLTQKELGEACGIHEVAIRKYELGKNIPKPEQLRKIAEALNVNVNSLSKVLNREISPDFIDKPYSTNFLPNKSNERGRIS